VSSHPGDLVGRQLTVQLLLGCCKRSARFRISLACTLYLRLGSKCTKWQQATASQSKTNTVWCMDLEQCLHWLHWLHWLHLEPTHLFLHPDSKVTLLHVHQTLFEARSICIHRNSITHRFAREVCVDPCNVALREGGTEKRRNEDRGTRKMQR
jgi:hypothetical protein